ncbi:hypothetical protein A3Q56_01495 [Intoshia linei]|uniref:Cyclin-like domain-containing protein n=1 Tax=Intoshia linei TaxID=1819745 RepID=A0A177BAV9_9BILA|nr:hypothetical protein A3Q56_01495 [Intoshia linei]
MVSSYKILNDAQKIRKTPYNIPNKSKYIKKRNRRNALKDLNKSLRNKRNKCNATQILKDVKKKCDKTIIKNDNFMDRKCDISLSLSCDNLFRDFYTSAIIQNEIKRGVQSYWNIVEINQPHISTAMKRSLCEWLYNIGYAFEVCNNTILMALRLIEKFLHRQVCPVTQFQLLGVTCLLISIKFQERYVPELEDILPMCDASYNEVDILNFEVFILNVLDTIYLPTCSFFDEVIMEIINGQKIDEILKLTLFISQFNEICLNQLETGVILPYEKSIANNLLAYIIFIKYTRKLILPQCKNYIVVCIIKSMKLLKEDFSKVCIIINFEKIYYYIKNCCQNLSNNASLSEKILRNHLDITPEYVFVDFQILIKVFSILRIV